MAQGDIRCRRCDAPMQTGFLIDKAASNIGAQQTEWVEGVLEDHKFLGMNTGMPKLGGHLKYDVVAYRCPQCAGVEMFAPAADTLLRPASDS